MKTPQNVLKMSIMSRDTSTETATPMTAGCNNNQMVKLAPSTNYLCFSSVKHQ